MSDNFDLSHSIKNDFAFYTYGHFQLPDEAGHPRLNNKSNKLSEAIEFLASGETIITNSFHGTYWGLLLGRKVVCIPFSSKFYGYKAQPAYCTDGDWRSAAKRAITYNTEYLEESRDANQKFYRKVKSMISVRRRNK